MTEYVKFSCEIITPMFLRGADANTPEFRSQSFKGALRFWWRAIHANLVTKEKERFNYSSLKNTESSIFGGIGGNGGKSKITISIDNNNADKKYGCYYPTPHNKKFKNKAFSIGNKFDILIGLKKNKHIRLNQIKNLFIVFSLLGGVGNRSRRGFGCFRILEIDNNSFCQPVTVIDDIVKLIREINSNFTFESSNLDFPHIKKIEIGKINKDITLKIGKATHKIKVDNPMRYNAAMGGAINGRFASPVYVSVIKNNGNLFPIITTLNTTTVENAKIQKQFINELL